MARGSDKTMTVLRGRVGCGVGREPEDMYGQGDVQHCSRRSTLEREHAEAMAKIDIESFSLIKRYRAISAPVFRSDKRSAPNDSLPPDDQLLTAPSSFPLFTL